MLESVSLPVRSCFLITGDVKQAVEKVDEPVNEGRSSVAAWQLV